MNTPMKYIVFKTVYIVAEDIYIYIYIYNGSKLRVYKLHQILIFIPLIRHLRNL